MAKAVYVSGYAGVNSCDSKLFLIKTGQMTNSPSLQNNSPFCTIAMLLGSTPLSALELSCDKTCSWFSYYSITLRFSSGIYDDSQYDTSFRVISLNPERA